MEEAILEEKGVSTRYLPEVLHLSLREGDIRATEVTLQKLADIPGAEGLKIDSGEDVEKGRASYGIGAAEFHQIYPAGCDQYQVVVNGQGAQAVVELWSKVAVGRNVLELV